MKYHSLKGISKVEILGIQPFSICIHNLENLRNNLFLFLKALNHICFTCAYAQEEEIKNIFRKVW